MSSNRTFAYAITAVMVGSVGALAMAQEQAAEHPQEFTVSESLSDKIYLNSRSSMETANGSGTWVETALRIYFPTDFDLANKYFSVPYASNTKTIVGFSVGPHVPIYLVAGNSVESFMRIGYAYSQGIYDAETDSGLAVRDAIELQWIPTQAGLAATSRPLFGSTVRAGVYSSAGVDWFTQTGQLDGMNQTFWVPRLELGGSISFFGSGAGDAASAGFDGLKLSAVTYRSFASSQKNRGWAADIGARYAF